MHRILIIDDDRTVCKSLELLLGKSGYKVKSIHHPAVVDEFVNDYQPHLVVLDMNFTIDSSGKQGLRLLDSIKAVDQKISVILITGWATLQLAVEGMKRGAADFLAKPWDNKHLLNSITTALELHHSDGGIGDTDGDHGSEIIGKSDSLLRVLSIVDRVARTEASVLITGESGTGKEVIAEAIHQKSKRKEAPFVKVNLGGISNTLFESEMFGHKKGAFTDASADRQGRFAKAEGGTIFLDEVGDLVLDSQVKLLRVLQEKTYEVLGSSRTIKTNVRVVSATHRVLPQMVDEGSFREDLFYRINLIHIHVPSLAERSSDIPLLVDFFLKNVSASYEINRPYVDEEAYDWLSRQAYPGNIRQLRNIVERTALLSMDKKSLDIKSFQANMVAQNQMKKKIVLPQIGQVTLEELEKQMILKALAHHNNSISKTARSLGLTRSSLYRRMEKYQISIAH